MKRNEKTSAKIAAIAGRILAHKAEPLSNMCLLPLRQAQFHLSWADLRAVAGSALTQTADKPKRKVGAWRYRKRSVVKKGRRK